MANNRYGKQEKLSSGTFLKRTFPGNLTETPDEIHQLTSNGIAIFEKSKIENYFMTDMPSSERVEAKFLKRYLPKNKSQVPDEIAMLRKYDYVVFSRTLTQKYTYADQFRPIEEEILKGYTRAGSEILDREFETQELATINDNPVVIPRCVCCE